VLVQKAYGNEAMNRSKVFMRYEAHNLNCCEVSACGLNAIMNTAVSTNQ